jgi:hypothetical protein
MNGYRWHTLKRSLYECLNCSRSSWDLGKTDYVYIFFSLMNRLTKDLCRENAKSTDSSSVSLALLSYPALTNHQTGLARSIDNSSIPANSV